ncbi:MAG: amidohydrolase family protein [Pseudohongiellaceae bacterium]
MRELMSKPLATLQITARMLLILALFAVPAARAQSTLFANGTLIIGDGTVIENGSILVSNGDIVAVGPSVEVPVPEDARRVDMTGRVLMPTLIDGHAHLGYQSPASWGAENYHRANLVGNLQQYAYYGFGAVFSAGSDPDQLALALQKELAGNALDTARFLFAAGMGPPGQGPNDAFLEETASVEARTGMTILRGIDSPVQAIERAREAQALGIEFIKLWVDDRGGSQTRIPEDHYLPLIAEAMRQRVPVFVHQQYASDMPPLLAAGASGFLHGRLGPELTAGVAEATARARAFVVPNLGLGALRRETIGNDPFLAQVLPPEVSTRLSTATSGRRNPAAGSPQQDTDVRAAMDRLLSAGVDIVLGTDAGALPDHPFGYTGHRELEIFVRLGMTPMQALVAATGAAARHLRQPDLGVLAPGRRANLLVLSANPLADIRNTRQIDAVYLGGERVDRAAIAEQLRGQ